MSYFSSPMLAIAVLSVLLVHQKIAVYGNAISNLVTPMGVTLEHLSVNHKRTQVQYVTQTFERHPPNKYKQVDFKMNHNADLLDSENDTDDRNYTFVYPDNNYKCPPCVCTDRKDGVLTASCNLVNISEVPQNLTTGIEILTVTECSIIAFDMSEFKLYRNLKSVIISNNTVLNTIRRSSGSNPTSTILTLFIDKNHIEMVESYSFTDMLRLQTLSLTENRLNKLTENMFSGLRSLRRLDVSRNNILFVDNKTFDDLNSLLILDISGNLLQVNNPQLLPPSAFLNINQLEELYIQGNCERDLLLCSFPQLVIQPLKRLRVLAIDVHNENGIGPESTTLLNLHTLIIDSNSFCTTRMINETFFDQTPNLVSLTIQNCPLVSILPKAYSKLLHLENLTIKAVPPDYNLCLALSDIQGLQNASLKYLSLSGVNKYDCACRKLDVGQGKYFKQHNLIELDLSWNNIITIIPGFTAMLPKSLKKIDLSGNDLSAGVLYRPLRFPDELTELNLSYETYQYTSQCSAKDVERDDKSMNDNYSRLDDVDFSEKPYDDKYIYASNMSRKSFEFNTMEQEQPQNGRFQFVNPLYFHFPINVKIWNAIKFPQFGTLVLRRVYEQNSSLTKIHFSGGFFETWGTSHMLSRIKHADLSNNFCTDMSTKFLTKNNSLEHLSAANNYLGNVFSNDSQGLLFGKAKRLKYLDISKNLINEIPKKFFKGLVKLQTLITTDNKLEQLHSSFSHMKDLTLIDFSRNSITWMSRNTRDDLDLIAMGHEVYLDLTSNPLPCTCSGIELMQWLATTNVFLLNRDFLVCVNETNEIQEIGDVGEMVQILKRRCTSKNALIVTCVFVISSFSIVLTASMMYRYRWWLRYLLNVALAKLFGKKLSDNTNTFQFDAYILCTDETRFFVLRDCVRELETNRGHRLCIEERDFLPGTYMPSDILSGVRNSAATVAMVTPEFYEDDLSEYRIKMALMEERSARRTLLYVCMCEPTRDEDLSDDLLTLLRNNRYIECPPLDETIANVGKEYWDQFSLLIGRSVWKGMVKQT
ncbi:unnamed protein product [Lymnaea stagnalis]|uniref:TIR domain-containing protein n=1 Tax=Lymnaea stagnalis TaxID=6523 RepID=A0AAV2IC03_LYMST